MNQEELRGRGKLNSPASSNIPICFFDLSDKGISSLPPLFKSLINIRDVNKRTNLGSIYFEKTDTPWGLERLIYSIKCEAMFTLR